MVSKTAAVTPLVTVSAAANNAQTVIGWSLDGPSVANAQGVRITRINTADASRTVLMSPTPFQGQTGNTKPSDVWPIQKAGLNRYYDFGVPQGSYKYEVTLMLGTSGSLVAGTATGVSNVVHTGTQMTQLISACFNDGIMSKQEISRWINDNCPAGALDAATAAQAPGADQTDVTEMLQPLKTAISTPGHPLREQLAAGMIEFAKSVIQSAVAAGGHVYDASYEVTDTEWVQFLAENAASLSIILANIKGGENADTLSALQSTKAEVIDRKLTNSSGIAHNKTQVGTDSQGSPIEIITGADNKTSTGFCDQASNAVRVTSPALAAQVLAYWNQLKDDTVNHNSDQGPALRQFCNTFQAPVLVPNGDGTSTTIQAIFAPDNLSAQKPDTGLTPALQYLQNIIDQLEPGDIAVSNLFGPGHIGVQDMLAKAKSDKPGIILKVAINSFMGMPQTMPPAVPGEDPPFIVAQSLHAPFANLLPEILGVPGAHAFIHSKYLVIFKKATKQFIVITGSHNLGEKADADNDETLLVLTGCTPLGLAYLANGLAVYDHFLFRYRVNTNRAGNGYLVEDGSWQTVNAAQSNEISAIMAALACGA
jgi:phosphatidylserine/phosphatidylglycerophosphate/cardiolipin synthase-like enzyme